MRRHQDEELSREDREALQEMAEARDPRPQRPDGSPQDDQLRFFEFWMWIIVVLPMALLLILSWRRKKHRPAPFTATLVAETFIEDVLQCVDPVVVHFHHPWNVGDQINLAQVEKLAARADGGYRVGTIDVEANPAILELYDNLEAPALLLFIDGERVMHVEGLFEEADVHRELLEHLDRHRARGSGAEEID